MATRCGAAALLLVLSVRLSAGQSFSLPLRQPQDCGHARYFDISSLACGQCGPHQGRSAWGISCVCLPGFKMVSNNGGPSVICEKCPENMSGITEDGWNCITCPKGLTTEGKCKCAINEILVERDVNGKLLNEALCIRCDANKPSFSASNVLGDRCIRCEQTFINISESCDCSDPNILTGGLCFSNSRNFPSKPVATVRYGQLADKGT